MKMPVLDKDFYPMIKALDDFDAQVKKSGKNVKGRWLWNVAAGIITYTVTTRFATESTTR